MPLIYLQPMPFPSAQTHTIQIARTVAALGEQTDVLLVVGRLTVAPGDLAEAVSRTYGVRFGPRVRVIAVPRWRLGGPWFPFSLRPILTAAAPDAAFYTRSFPMVRRLLRFRWLHGRRVFLETHKKAGYLKEDPVPGSRYDAIRRRFEETNDSVSEIAATYSAVDGVFFLHRHSLAEVRRRQPVRVAAPPWHGWRPLTSGPSEPGETTTRAGVVHCGSIAEHELFDLLADALDRTEVTVTVYGGEPARVAGSGDPWPAGGASDRLSRLGRSPGPRRRAAAVSPRGRAPGGDEGDRLSRERGDPDPPRPAELSGRAR